MTGASHRARVPAVRSGAQRKAQPHGPGQVVVRLLDQSVQAGFINIVLMSTQIDVISCELVDGPRLVVPDSSDLLSSSLVREPAGWVEDGHKRLWRLVWPGELGVERGANHGVDGLMLVRRGAPSTQLWAFEPASDVAAAADGRRGDPQHQRLACCASLFLQGLEWRLCLCHCSAHQSWGIGADPMAEARGLDPAGSWAHGPADSLESGPDSERTRTTAPRPPVSLPPVLAHLCSCVAAHDPR